MSMDFIPSNEAFFIMFLLPISVSWVEWDDPSDFCLNRHRAELTPCSFEGGERKEGHT